MTAHFAQVALALVTGGAAVLIIAGLVSESRYDRGRHLHLFPELANPGDERPAAASEAPATPRFPAAPPEPRFQNAGRRAARNAESKKPRARKQKRRERRARKRTENAEDEGVRIESSAAE